MANAYEKYLKRMRGNSEKLLTGNKSYGPGGSNSPHSGGGLDKSGYIDRDREAKMKRDFLMKQLRNGGF